MNQATDQHRLEVVLSWGETPLSERLLDTPTTVRVGEGDDAVFSLPHEVIGDDFTMLVPDGEGFALCAPPQAHIVAQSHGAPVEVVTDERGFARLPLDASVTAELHVGDFHFYLRTVDAPAKVERSVGIDWHATRFIGASFATAAALLGLFMLLPADASALSSNLGRQDQRYIEFQLDAMSFDTPDVETAHGSDGQGATDAPTEAGESGSPDATDPEVGGSEPGGDARPGRGAVSTRAPLTAEDVSNLGVFSAWSAATAGHHGESSPFAASNAANFGPGSLPGFGPGNGSGLDMTGTGRGTCRPGERCGEGTIASDLRTHGTPRGTGDVGPLRRPGGGDVPPALTIGNVTTRGGLTRNDIRRVVRRNLAQVRHCYQQQLQSRPDLEGRVAVRFFVSPTGAVTTAGVQQDTVGGGNVAQCVAGKVRQWSFPRSESMTAVTYPFVFHSNS